MRKSPETGVPIYNYISSKGLEKVETTMERNKTVFWERGLSLLLALMLVLSLVPAGAMTARAEGSDEPVDSSTLEPGTYVVPVKDRKSVV